jgi:hypothetical protein
VARQRPCRPRPVNPAGAEKRIPVLARVQALAALDPCGASALTQAPPRARIRGCAGRVRMAGSSRSIPDPETCMRSNVRDEPRRASVSSRAAGSIALLGSSSTTMLGSTFRTLWCGLYKCPALAGSFTLMLANGRGDSVNIEVMGPTDSLSELVEFLDDGVPALHDGFLGGSSSGVQMMGGADLQSDRPLRSYHASSRSPDAYSSMSAGTSSGGPPRPRCGTHRRLPSPAGPPAEPGLQQVGSPRP